MGGSMFGLILNITLAIKVLIIGDSVVFGWGGGHNYPKYVSESGDEVSSLGIPGATINQLRSAASSINTEIVSADVIIIDAGRNGAYNNENPSDTAQNVRRFAKELRSKNKRAYVTASTMIKSRRPEVAVFNKQFNQELMRLEGNGFNVDLKFHRLPDSILSGDDLHPSFEGLRVIAGRVVSFLGGL